MMQARSDAEIIASLQKPGAGVPVPQRLLLRYVIGPFVAGRSNWDKDSAVFLSVGRKLVKDAEKLSEAQLGQRVLIPSQMGLEDSSRYWSAAMVLEHMVVVSKGVAGIVTSLSKGIVPDFEVEMARVKPKGEIAPQDALEQFKAYYPTAPAQLDAAVADRKAKAQLKHPWFGPFNAHQWHWLMASHAVVHLNQMRAISWRLNPPKLHSK